MQPEQTDLGTLLTDDAVLGFLTSHPEFFVTNQAILPRLRIPHDSGNAVSLIEKQVSVLRNKCSSLENSLRDLISVARENENLHQRLHVLIQEIICATTLEQIITLTRNSLRENFNADEVHVLLVAAKPARAAARKATAKTAGKSDGQSGGKSGGKSAGTAKAASASTGKATTRARKTKAVEGLQIVAHNDKRIKLFDQLFDSGETQCGLPGAEQLDCLVGKDCSNIASAAMIPLHHERQLGVVMLTSRDESRFASGKGVMFLNQLGELLGRRLHTYGAISAASSK